MLEEWALFRGATHTHTELSDREGEVRAERIARIQVKLEKYKKLLQEEESSLQEAQNVYVSGMEESISDKEQQK